MRAPLVVPRLRPLVQSHAMNVVFGNRDGSVRDPDSGLIRGAGVEG